MDPRHPITLETIANAANVGKSTVSLALRNHPKISEKTRTRVQQLARDMGYRINPLVSAHMAQIRGKVPQNARQTLGFIANRDLSEVEKDHLRPLRQYYYGARDRAHALGYHLDYYNLAGKGINEHRLSNTLVEREIHGIIIAPLSDGRGIEGSALQWEHFASVMIEHTFIDPRLHCVCLDEFSTIGRLLQRLLDYGFNRIGIALHTRMDRHANHFWLAGYQAYQALASPEDRIPHFIRPEWDEEKFLAWYRQHRPEAIITCNDDIVAWLRRAGHQVPEEVSCTSLYWREERGHLSGFYQNHEIMASNAVDLVVSQLNRNERGLPHNHKTVMVQPDWRPGNTVIRRSSPDHQSHIRVWTR